MLQVKNLHKRFPLKDAHQFKPGIKKISEQQIATDPRIKGRYFYAIQNVSFECKEGEVLGLLGANGAGKTTLLRMLSTALKADQGDIFFKHNNLNLSFINYRRSIGFLSGSTGLYDRLTGYENLAYFARLYGLTVKNTTARIQLLTEQLGMANFIHRRFSDYSTGMKQRIAIARAVLHEPSLVILDEPTTGLDIKAREIILQFIETLSAENISVIFSTHDLAEVERLCQRVCVIEQGENRFIGSLTELKTQTETDSLHQALFNIMDSEAPV